MVTGSEWHKSAACAGADPEMFFPRSYSPANVSSPLALCAVCPVRDACLADALADWQEYGIFGGMLPAERRRMAGIRNGRKPSTPRPLAPHGTHGAAMRHRRAKEPNCDECRAFLAPIKYAEKQRRKARKTQGVAA